MSCGFKYDVRNLENFHPTTQKSKNVIPMGYFCQKYMSFELKKIQRSYLSSHWTVMQNLNKHWPCGLKSGMRNWLNFYWSTQKSENGTMMGCFCPKHTLFQLENFRGIMCHDTEGCCEVQTKTDLWLEKWHKKFGSFSCKQLKVWKFALWLDPFVHSIPIFRWKSTEELCLMTLKSDAKFEEKPTLGSKNDMRTLVNFNASSGKSRNFYFDVLLLPIAYEVSVWKVQKYYL